MSIKFAGILWFETLHGSYLSHSRPQQSLLSPDRPATLTNSPTLPPNKHHLANPVLSEALTLESRYAESDPQSAVDCREMAP